jgi:hypothetical protein
MNHRLEEQFQIGYVYFACGKNMVKPILNPIYKEFMEEWKKMKACYRLEHHREFGTLFTWFRKGYNKKDERIGEESK